MHSPSMMAGPSIESPQYHDSQWMLSIRAKDCALLSLQQSRQLHMGKREED